MVLLVIAGHINICEILWPQFMMAKTSNNNNNKINKIKRSSPPKKNKPLTPNKTNWACLDWFQTFTGWRV